MTKFKKDKLYYNRMKRRDLLKAVGSALALKVLGIGCAPSYYDYYDYYEDENEYESTTGVPGLNTPDEILDNSNLQQAISRMESFGFDFNLYRTSLNPPKIEGYYHIQEGYRYFPGETPLSKGSWKWYDQRHNKIKTDYSQFSEGESQTGVSSYGEIIRGRGSYFTIYSVLRIKDTSIGCSDRALLVVDGTKNNKTVHIVYAGAPVYENSCLLQSGGWITLNRISGAKTANKNANSQRESGFLLGRE